MKKRIALMLALIFILCYVPVIAVLADDDIDNTEDTATTTEVTTTEPTTEPITDPETTEPESTEPESTEPESTEPVTTEPENNGDNTPVVKHPIKKYLLNHAVMSYKYRAQDDYYYCDINNAWQKQYGYTRIYDLFAPYILLEYDYIRVHFTYEGKDWLVQFWKGQYGTVFYGSEVGLYYKDSDGKADSYSTHYNCPSDGDCITMQTNLYQKNYLTGEYEHRYSTPTESTWWSTGFKAGHLVKEEPANELRQTGTLTFKNEEMTAAFVEAMKGCGVPEVTGEEEMQVDSFYVDGCTVHFSWQNISGAENTMLIKSASSVAAILTSGIFFGPLVMAIGTFGALSLLAFLLLK